MLEIPLNSNPEQLFSIVLNGTKYNCRVLLNSRTGVWNISFSIGDTSIVSGVPILSGVDILSQYPEIDIKNIYAVNLENTDSDPTRDNLGSASKLIILTDEELGNV